MVYSPQRLMGNEQLSGAAEVELRDANVIDFWQWAFSNLCLNDVRGVFAEWMVAKLLGISQPLRHSWDECDLISPEGVKIEVKTSAYVQAWEQKQPSKIQFTRLRARRLDLATNIYSDISTYNADIYVFCVQIEQNPAYWNALDLDQWRFYTVSQSDMELLGHRSLSLPAIERLSVPLSASAFVQQMKEMIADCVQRKVDN